MRRVYLTRVYRFCAGHRLYDPTRSDAWNRETFGKCSNPGGHGHNYTLEVTVRGAPDPEAGWVMPASELDRLVWRGALDGIDHQNLNDAIPLRFGPAPTTEVLLLELWESLEPLLCGRGRLHRLKIRETSKNTFVYYGPMAAQNTESRARNY